MPARFFVRTKSLLWVTSFILVGCVSPHVINDSPPASATSAPQSPDGFIYSYLARGKYYQKIGDHTKAVQEFRNAYKALKPDASESLKGIVLNDLGEALLVSGHHKEAIPVCYSALRINLSCNNKIEAAISHLHLGDAIEKSGNLKNAKKHWEMANIMAIKMGHSELIKLSNKRPITTLTQF